MNNDDYPWPPPDQCLWCREPLLAHERRSPDDGVSTPAGRRYMHWECGLRSVAGGLNHLNGRCSCCGGDLPPDPPGISKREAARMAAQAWLARNP